MPDAVERARAWAAANGIDLSHPGYVNGLRMVAELLKQYGISARDAAAKAEKMLADGSDPEDVWRETGTYRRLAGEVEARNTVRRMNMTPAERRLTPPWKTQDIPTEEQIINPL